MQLKLNTPLYYASTHPESAGENASTDLKGLMNIHKGGSLLTDMMIFTNEQEAIDAARRLSALDQGRKALESLTTDQLIDIIPKINARYVK